MAFGSLLGSLYGNLPAPKSGSEPSQLPVSATSSASSEEAEGVDKGKTNEGNRALASSSLSSSSSSSSYTPLVSTPTPRSLLLMPPPLVRKREAAARAARGGTTLPQLKRSRDRGSEPALGTGTPQPGAGAKVPSVTDALVISDTSSSESSAFADCGSTHLLPQKLKNEYDPAKPNSYDEFVRERARTYKKREEERRQREEMERLREEQSRLCSTAAVPPPSLAISGEEAWKRRSQLSAALFGEEVVATVRTGTAGPTAVDAKPHGRGFAQKMLEKMGWKHGEGLGRDKQGILAPLVARKTDKRSGVIVQGDTALPSTACPPTPIMTPSGPTSRIVLLTNLVGKGEVDSDLESETAEEAAKFGNLLSVNISEDSSLPDDESVRIFCEYETSTAALKAVASFNGRLFGGRRVKAQCYLPPPNENTKGNSV